MLPILLMPKADCASPRTALGVGSKADPVKLLGLGDAKKDGSDVFLPVLKKLLSYLANCKETTSQDGQITAGDGQDKTDDTSKTITPEELACCLNQLLGIQNSRVDIADELATQISQLQKVVADLTQSPGFTKTAAQAMINKIMALMNKEAAITDKTGKAAADPLEFMKEVDALLADAQEEKNAVLKEAQTMASGASKDLETQATAENNAAQDAAATQQSTADVGQGELANAAAQSADLNAQAQDLLQASGASGKLIAQNAEAGNKVQQAEQKPASDPAKAPDTKPTLFDAQALAATFNKVRGAESSGSLVQQPKDRLSDFSTGAYPVIDANLALNQQNAVGDTKVEAPVPTQPQVQPQEIISQVVDRIHTTLRERVQEAYIELKPEFLGKAVMKVSMESGRVSVEMQVTSHTVKSTIESNFSSLKDSLQQKGYQVGDFNVTVYSDNQGQNRGSDDASFLKGQRPARVGDVRRNNDDLAVSSLAGAGRGRNYLGDAGIDYLI